MDSISISVDDVHSYYMKERQLYFRLVFILGIDPNRAMEVIAFWLWVEENGHTNIIREIYSFDDVHVLDVALIGLNFVKSLRLNHQSNVDDSSIDVQSNQKFHQEAVSGINYYLKNVCIKTFDDIRREVEKEAEIRKMKELVQQISQIHLDCRSPNSLFKHDRDGINLFKDDAVRFSNFTPLEDHDFKIKNPLIDGLYVPHGEGTSKNGGGRRSNSGDSDMHGSSMHPVLMDIEKRALIDHLFNRSMGNPPFQLKNHRGNVPIIGASFDPYQKVTFGDQLVMEKNALSQYYPMGPKSSSTFVGLWSQSQSNISREDRTLFVTFSNGYPLTKDDLYEFFMSRYGDVELITVEESKGGRPPLYAHVSFYSVATVLRILNGNAKVKFIAKGKHLWARRFIPKRKYKTDE